MATARRCDHCDNPYIAKNSRSRFCSDKCRADNGGKPRFTPQSDGGAVLTATEAKLDAVGLLDDPAARAALALARRVDANQDNGSALASLVKEFRATLAEVMAGAAKAGDAVDEMKARRDAKRRVAAG